MLLAGDVGGTNTRLGLFERGEPRPRPVAVRVYPTTAFASFRLLLDRFAEECPDLGRPVAAAIGVAGPVIDGSARLTHGAWSVDAAEVASRIDGGRVAIINDLESLARSVTALDDTELVVLQQGAVPPRGGHRAVIAAGTGLGEASLIRVAGRVYPMAAEAGHADFAARTDRELELVQFLRARYGRAEIEQVLSGPGLENLYRFTHTAGDCAAGARPDGRAASVTASALGRRCRRCEETLAMFVDALGAEAGNLALRDLTLGGVYVGGGIPPKILPALQDGRFVRAFRDKAPMGDLLSAMPVHVIVNPDAGLLGAAIAAQEMR